MNDTTRSITRNTSYADALATLDSIGVVAAIRPGAKNPITTRPRDGKAVCWLAVHKAEGHLAKGLERLLSGEEPELRAYVPPGALDWAGAVVLCYDCDKPGSREGLIELIGPPLGEQASETKPDHHHLWYATEGDTFSRLYVAGAWPGSGKFYVAGRHAGEIRTRSKSKPTCGVGMALYPGEAEMLAELIRKGPPERLLGEEQLAATDARPWTKPVAKASTALAGLRHVDEGGDGRNDNLMACLRPLQRVIDHRSEYEPILVEAYEQAFAPGEDRDAAAEIAHALDTVRDTQAPAKRKRTPKLTIEDVMDELREDTLHGRLARHRIRVRYNVRWISPELSREDGPWEPVSDMAAANLRLLCGGLKWEDRVWRTLWLNTLYQRQVDPFLEYLEALPPWDGTPRVNAWASRAWGLCDGTFNHRMGAWTGIHVFLGAVARTLTPGLKLDTTPVIVGPQELGKSWHLTVLFPDALRGAFGDSLQLSGDERRMLEALQGKVLVEISEMQGLTRAKLDSLKAFLTRLVDSVRLAYRENAEYARRLCVFVGTVNDDGNGVLPNDTTGNRRFAVLRVRAQGVHPLTLAEERDQLWAEALHRVRSGESPEFPEDMKQAQAEANEPLRMRDAFEDEIAEIEPQARQMLASDAYRQGIPPAVLWDMCGLLGREERDGDGKVTLRQGMLRTPAQVSRSEAMRFSAALRARGWRRRHGREGPRWLPPVTTS